MPNAIRRFLENTINRCSLCANPRVRIVASYPDGTRGSLLVCEHCDGSCPEALQGKCGYCRAMGVMGRSY